MASCAVEIRGRGDQPPAELISMGQAPAVRSLPVIQVDQIHDELEPMPAHILLGTLGAPRHRVVKAIPVSLSTENNLVVASWQNGEEFGTGASMSSALEDLGRTIAELFDSLHLDQERLGPDLTRVWNLLQEHVVESK